MLVLVVITALLSTSPTASTTRATRWRRRSRPGRWGRGPRWRSSGALNFVGAFLSLAVAATIASGLVDTAEGDADRGGGRPGRRHHLEPGHLAVRHPVQFLARAHRRGDRLHDSGGGRQRRALARPVSKVVLPGRALAGHRRARRRVRHLAAVPDHPVADRGGAQARLQDRADRVGLRGLARARHQRRAEDHGRHHPRPDRQRHPGEGVERADLGHRLLRARHLRSAPTSAAGGSSARWARAWSRSRRRRAWRPSPPRPPSSCCRATFGYSLSTTHVATGSIIGTGLGKKGAEVRWNVAGRMATAWVFTLPSAAIVGAAADGTRARHRRHLRRHRRPHHPGRARRFHLLAVPRPPRWTTTT